MNKRFDELTKSLAQSVTGPAALKKFSIGLATSVVVISTLLATSDCQSADFNCYTDWDGTLAIIAYTGIVVLLAKQGQNLNERSVIIHRPA